MKINRDELARIKQKCDLMALISSELHKVANRHGGEYAGPCPFCGGEDRFHIQPFVAGGRWFCRQCTGDPTVGGWRDLFDFVMQQEQLTFPQAVAYVAAQPLRQPRLLQRAKAKPTAQWCSPDWQRRATKAMKWGVQGLGQSAVGQRGRDYLRKRSIASESWQAWGLGFGNVWHARRRHQVEAILLPWWAGVTLQAIQYRYVTEGLAKAERYGQRTGGERLLFGLPLRTGQPTLLMVEGELNAISIWQACRDQEIDVLSWGPQENLLRAPVLELVREIRQDYRQLILWADQLAIVQEAAQLLSDAGASRQGITGVASPHGEDANTLLQNGDLRTFVKGIVSEPIST